MRNIKCRTVFMKAQTNVSEDGILLEALSEDDLQKVSELILIAKSSVLIVDRAFT